MSGSGLRKTQQGGKKASYSRDPVTVETHSRGIIFKLDIASQREFSKTVDV